MQIASNRLRADLLCIIVIDHGNSNEFWDDSDDDYNDEDAVEVSTEVLHIAGDNDAPDFVVDDDSDQFSKLVCWMVGFLLTMQSKYYISDAALNVLVKFLSVFFNVIGKFCQPVAIYNRQNVS